MPENDAGLPPGRQGARSLAFAPGQFEETHQTLANPSVFPPRAARAASISSGPIRTSFVQLMTNQVLALGAGLYLSGAAFARRAART